MRRTLQIIGLLVLSMLMVACSSSLDFEDGDIVVSAEFNIDEELLNSGDTTALSFGNVELMQNASYDIQDGQVVVNGDLLCEDGSRENGAVTVVLGTSEAGFINVEITDVTSDCEVESNLITEAQEEMASSLAEAARELQQSEATVTFNEVSVGDDTITIALEVRAPLNNNQ